MDDLYEGWQSTLTPILTLKLQDLLETLQSTSKIIYEPYDWLAESKRSAISVPPPEFLIIEGVGSGQSSIRKFVSLALWIEVPVEEGLARVLERDGAAVAQYLPAFLLAQEAHFKKEESRKSADYRLSGLGTV
jgi:uridine kinase